MILIMVLITDHESKMNLCQECISYSASYKLLLEFHPLFQIKCIYKYLTFQNSFVPTIYHLHNRSFPYSHVAKWSKRDDRTGKITSFT